MTLKEYLDNVYSKTSARGYYTSIQRFILTLGVKAETATYTDVVGYISLLRDQQVHPKTLRNNLFAIKMYYRYLVLIGKRTEHPCQYLYLKDKINRAIPIESLYTKERLKDLYETWQSKTEIHQKRDKIIISLLIYQALTVLEITQLKTSDLDLEKGSIYVEGNLKNKSRMLGLKSEQILLFHNYLNKEYKQYRNKQKPSKRVNNFILSEEGLPLWSGGINRMINQGREKQDKLIPLKIRQSVIASLVKENNDIRIVQEFAGHRRTGSTEAYKQTGLEELKLSIEKLHPLQ
jgi:site-specific recombinase XerD